MPASFPKRSISPERLIAGETKSHGCVFCPLSFLPRILLTSSRGRKELLKGGSCFLSPLLNFMQISEAGFCRKKLWFFWTKTSTAKPRFSHFFGCKLEETGLCHLRCFQHRTLSEERAAVAPALVQRVPSENLHRDSPSWGAAGLSLCSPGSLKFKIFNLKSVFIKLSEAVVCHLLSQ